MNKNGQPPKFGQWLLKRFLNSVDRNHRLNDFAEAFSHFHREEGFLRAWKWYWSQVLRSIGLYFIEFIRKGTVMFKNYLKIALRNTIRQKSYTFINVAGLSIGMACFIVILLYVQYELSYDQYNSKADRIYRVVPTKTTSKSTDLMTRTAPLIGPTLKKDFGEIEESVRFLNWGGGSVRYKDKLFNEMSNFPFVEANVFSVFDFPLIQGDPETALVEKNSLVLSEDMVKKYFGDEDPMGKVMTVNGTTNYTVTGVMKNMPKKSHFHFDFLANFEGEYAPRYNSWSFEVFYTYVLLRKGIKPEVLEQKFPEFVDTYITPTFRNSDRRVSLGLQPLTDIHLKSHRKTELGTNGNIAYIYISITIAFLVLLVACINFMNLVTAQSARRMKEVAVRKVVGAYRFQLSKQFLTESMFLSVLSLMAALVLVQAVMPAFNDYAGLAISFNVLNNWVQLSLLLLFAMSVGLLSGIYPAFFLSSFRPAASLKGTIRSTIKDIFVRKGLVVVQFVTSIALVIGTLVVGDQISFIKNQDLGYARENILIVQSPGNSEYHTLKNALQDVPGVYSVTRSSDRLGRLGMTLTGWAEGMAESERVNIESLAVDPDFFKTYSMNLVAGRWLKEADLRAANTPYILNEKAMKMFGWNSPEEAIGKAFHSAGANRGSVVGIIKDFNWNSLHQEIQPIVMFTAPWGSQVSIRIDGNAMSETIALAKTELGKVLPEYPFEYSFFDDRLNELYASEEVFSSVFTLFSSLAIFIGCLGLYGLTSFTVEQKTKEIGIRKVLGSSISGILKLLSRELLKPIIAANLIAWPLAYILMRSWLEGFAYRTGLNIGIFFIAGGVVIAIALVAISSQTLKAAFANPVHSLRSD